MHESALENSDHWDTTKKAITNGGTIIWDSLTIHKILSSASLRSYLEVIVFGNHVKIHQIFQFGLVCWFWNILLVSSSNNDLKQPNCSKYW